MKATVEIPDDVLRELESLALREGVTANQVIRQLIEGHVQQQRAGNGSAELPLIPASETGRISDVTGLQIDEILSRDQLSA